MLAGVRRGRGRLFHHRICEKALCVAVEKRSSIITLLSNTTQQRIDSPLDVMIVAIHYRLYVLG